jgi:AraC family transcriptional regulator
MTSSYLTRSVILSSAWRRVGAWEKLLDFMTQNSRQTLASGDGWRVDDFICTSGPHDRPFQEQHRDFCFAVVTNGTFRYRSTFGSATMAAGAMLLGNSCDHFECGHDHSVGDRCLPFHVSPSFLEGVVAAIPGARQLAFGAPQLPPLPELLPLVARAEAARDSGDADEFEELALSLAGAVASALTQTKKSVRAPSARDERRISAALRCIERRVDETPSLESLSLVDLARTAAMSPYHFLRTFRAVVGMTPHQYILHTRLRSAATRLRSSSDAVSAIAFDAGFNDLSTFNRRFKRLTGLSPSAYRAAR